MEMLKHLVAQKRIGEALAIAVRYGGIDGDHHKRWVIDQMVRALTGCPEVEAEAKDARGKTYTYVRRAESTMYLELVREARAGENGPETYDWDLGVAP